ncbi:MAG TPA: hypothetical protein VGY77_03995 [Gemmataceae bacterium]|jgi:hypothetical protein|nr:hypothetical protein [Gemmataceae bacterium]
MLPEPKPIIWAVTGFYRGLELYRVLPWLLEESYFFNTQVKDLIRRRTFQSTAFEQKCLDGMPPEHGAQRPTLVQ